MHIKNLNQFVESLAILFEKKRYCKNRTPAYFGTDVFNTQISRYCTNDNMELSLLIMTGSGRWKSEHKERSERP